MKSENVSESTANYNIGKIECLNNYFIDNIL